MIRELQRRIDEHAPDAKLLRAPAEDLPFEDDSFDVGGIDARAVLRRRPAAGSQGAATGPAAGRPAAVHGARPLRGAAAGAPAGQDEPHQQHRRALRLQPPTLDSIRAAGFSIEKLEHGTLEKAPPFVRPLVVGVAEAWMRPCARVALSLR